jgi:hypothetical protein
VGSFGHKTLDRGNDVPPDLRDAASYVETKTFPYALAKTRGARQGRMGRAGWNLC